MLVTGLCEQLTRAKKLYAHKFQSWISKKGHITEPFVAVFFLTIDSCSASLDPRMVCNLLPVTWCVSLTFFLAGGW